MDRLGDALYLLQAIGGAKNPVRIAPLPRPGAGGQRVGEMRAPPKMSSKEEIRAFFGLEGTKVIYSDS